MVKGCHWAAGEDHCRVQRGFAGAFGTLEQSRHGSPIGYVWGMYRVYVTGLHATFTRLFGAKVASKRRRFASKDG